MNEQYSKIKAAHPDALLLFRCGDFYEAYHEDAAIVAKVLGITLARRHDNVNMAGFPYHALEVYLPKLVRAGHKVAICDQLEKPKTKNHKSMKTIILRQMKFTNFKGIRHLELDFNKDTTVICGANGTGKTSVFDGFIWVLFGKDAQDRKQFGIKTIENGVEIPKIEHEVTATIEVDGEQITLTRRFNEKWVRSRGDRDEVYQGNYEERLYNGVPCSVSEWSEKINAICSESVFKLITNPHYFTSLGWKEQRQILIDMVGGEVADSLIANSRDDFRALIESLNGKTLDELTREIASKKKTVKQSIDGIPARIDEQKRTISTLTADWSAIETEIATNEQEQARIEGLINAEFEKWNAAAEVYNQAGKKLMQAQNELANIRFKLEQSLMEDYNKAFGKKIELKTQITAKQRELESLQTQILNESNQHHKLSEQLAFMRKEFADIQAEQIKIDESQFVCPTCGRAFDEDVTTEKRNAMIADFNAHKAARLKANREAGTALKAKADKHEQRIADLDQQARELGQKIDDMQAEFDAIYKDLTRPDFTETVNADPSVQAQEKVVNDLQEAYNNMQVAPKDDAQLKADLRAIQGVIQDLKTRLSKRDQVKAANDRIAELESELTAKQDELSRLENTEITIAEFKRAKVDAIEGKINSLFDIVRFKLTQKQVNGAEVETCEATANGVPYSTQNAAMQMNMGIDIINALCRKYEITAPIVVDNAESYNTILTTQGQLICLVVTEDKQLIIK